MLTVEKIENGSVIDHIKAGRGLDVLRILNINGKYEGRVALVMNVPSKKMGKKDIVKIEGKRIDEKSANKIALIAPDATLNIINEGKVVDKSLVKLPNTLTGIIKCLNPKCITNNERVETIFYVEKGKAILLKCAFCEKVFKPEEMII